MVTAYLVLKLCFALAVTSLKKRTTKKKLSEGKEDKESVEEEMKSDDEVNNLHGLLTRLIMTIVF